MPYYGIPMDQTDENVAFAFNKRIITGLLRDSLGFEGVVCTDWNIINDSKVGEARAWGVENLTPLMRTKKFIDAGCDQFGGEFSPELIVELVRNGEIVEERLDVSIKRILRDKFKLGLFDNPYVDAEKAGSIAGKSEFREKGRIAQAKSTVLLKNENLLPLKPGMKIYVHGMVNPKELEKFGKLVGNPDEADVMVLRIKTPYEDRSDYFIEKFFHQGRLYYSEKELSQYLSLISNKPSIVVANIERPMILTEISEASAVLMAEFGTSDEVLAKLLFGEVKPTGKLPFEFPSSWDSVLGQKEDLPYDSKDPLYPFGYGLGFD